MKFIYSFIFVFGLLSSASAFQAQVCMDQSGSERAAIAYHPVSKELTMKVKIQPGYTGLFTAVEIKPSVYEGRNGLSSLKPVLDLKKQTLTIGSEVIQLKCSAYRGGE